jgi:hypothetical protein
MNPANAMKYTAEGSDTTGDATKNIADNKKLKPHWFQM